MNKPKVLIREIPFRREPLELVMGKHGKDFILGELALQGVKKPNVPN